MKTLVLYYDGKDLKSKAFESPTMALVIADKLKQMPSILKVTIVNPDQTSVVIK